MKWITALVGLAAVGVTITGVLGLTLGMVAYLLGDAHGGGTCLIAAAVAFGLSLLAVLKP